MGFWQVEGTSKIIGDGPVDRLEEHLRSFSVRNAKPDFIGFLNAVRDVLEVAPKRLKALFHPPQPEIVDSGTADPALRDELVGAIEEIRGDYDMAIGREPTLDELLDTFAFSLRVRPERFLRNCEGLRLKEIVAE